MNRETIKEIMSNEGILPQVKFGQNFLCDENIISSIVFLCGISREDHVLEIGPGLGSLTVPLSELGCDLTCVEILLEEGIHILVEASGRDRVTAGFALKKLLNEPE